MNTIEYEEIEGLGRVTIVCDAGMVAFHELQNGDTWIEICPKGAMYQFGVGNVPGAAEVYSVKSLFMTYDLEVALHFCKWDMPVKDYVSIGIQCWKNALPTIEHASPDLSLKAFVLIARASAYIGRVEAMYGVEVGV